MALPSHCNGTFTAYAGSCHGLPWHAPACRGHYPGNATACHQKFNNVHRESVKAHCPCDTPDGLVPANQTLSIPSNANLCFVKVLYGCVRYKDALRVFLKHYYNDMASSVLRSDFTLYMVLGYLLLFRLDELSFAEFRRLTSPEDPTKMAQLLNYLVDWQCVEVQYTLGPRVRNSQIRE